MFKLTDRDFLRSMENAIRFGKPCLLENVGEELDPALEPVLLKQVSLQPWAGARLSAWLWAWPGRGQLPSPAASHAQACSTYPSCPPQTYKQQGNMVLKLGDTVIPYHEDFRMYITTKLPNPHYTPEIASKLTLINFTLSPRSAPSPPAPEHQLRLDWPSYPQARTLGLYPTQRLCQLPPSHFDILGFSSPSTSLPYLHCFYLRTPTPNSS